MATTPYAAYHFHRIAPYGVLANLLAMPIVSAWVMPMGILGVLAMPFGLDAEFWRQMGYGIEWMDGVGLWVASLPGAFGRVILFGTGPLLLATAGLLVVGLLKTPLRFSGFILAALAALWAALPAGCDRHRGARRSAAGLPGNGDRASVMAGAWCADASPRGFGLCDAIGAVEEFRRPWSPAVVSPAVAPAAAPDVRATSPVASAKPAGESAKSAPDGAKSRARSHDATPREEDIEADELAVQ